MDQTTVFLLKNFDPDDAHPFHIHGHSFWVLGMGNNRSDIYLPRSVNYNAVQKDTVVLPAGGWVAIVVEADNPGYWLFHCHVEWHMPTGMTVLLIDSEKDIDKPPRNFPTCYPYPNGTLFSGSFFVLFSSLLLLILLVWFFTHFQVTSIRCPFLNAPKPPRPSSGFRWLLRWSRLP